MGLDRNNVGVIKYGNYNSVNIYNQIHKTWTLV